jgi:hypothetical protein
MNASHDVARLIFVRCFNVAIGNSWCFNYYFTCFTTNVAWNTMFQVFYPDVSSIFVWCFTMNVAWNIQCFKCFIWMFQVFLSDVSRWMLHEKCNVFKRSIWMFQVLYLNVSSVLSECCNYFYLSVAYGWNTFSCCMCFAIVLKVFSNYFSYFERTLQIF